MSFEVRSIAPFDRNFRRLSKKYPTLRSDLAALAVVLSNEPQQGTPIGDGCYKIRLAIRSKSKGKSGGDRVITYVAVAGKVVYLLTIYDKSEQENIPRKELMALRSFIP